MIDVGTVLEGRYEITRLLAHGGMSAVFLARDRSLERDVAIKVVHLSRADDRLRLEREARLLARMEHPNLVRVYVAGHTETEAYLALEYVAGATLAQRIAGGALSLDDTAHIGIAVARALAFVHDQGVVHRDVKPSNVFIGDDGRTRLSDFGIARHGEDADLTRTGMVMGTGVYMAPEQVEGQPVTPAADVYTLGLVLIECLTGVPAFAGTPSEAAIARLARAPEIPVVAASWTALLAAMTARDPQQRPSAAQVSAQLERLPTTDPLATAPMRATAEHAPPTTMLPVPAAVAARPPTRHLGALLGLITLAVALLAGFALTRGPDGDTPAAPPTTSTTSRASTSTTARPTTTTTPCDQLQAQRDAIDEQERQIDQQLKGKPADQAKRRLEDQKQALDNELKSCG